MLNYKGYIAQELPEKEMQALHKMLKKESPVPVKKKPFTSRVFNSIF